MVTYCLPLGWLSVEIRVLRMHVCRGRGDIIAKRQLITELYIYLSFFLIFVFLLLLLFCLGSIQSFKYKHVNFSNGKQILLVPL